MPDASLAPYRLGSGPGREVVIVDSGLGNIGALVNMISRVGGRAVVTSDSDTVAAAPRLLLPGVGAFDRGMAALRTFGLDIAIQSAAKLGTPILGVCLGMQMLVESSEEGVLPGLALIDGVCRKFPAVVQGRQLRVPHMGWASVTPQPENRPLGSASYAAARFYFAHSYYLPVNESLGVSGVSEYGLEFASVIRSKNIHGVQFHPEKSHRHGKDLLNAFLDESRESVDA